MVVETRRKYRIIVALTVVVLVVLLYISQKSTTSQSESGNLIEKLKEALREKEEEITKVRSESRANQFALRNAMKTREKVDKKLSAKPTQSIHSNVLARTSPIKYFKGHKLVHLDLKGAAPKMSYILKLLPALKSWGATGLLVEYEDMFPYYGELSVLKSHYAYSEDEIKKLLSSVKKENILMIPLVQTFGHMEFVLKHRKFSHLRHVTNMTGAINPYHKESLPLVKLIMNQIMKMHKGYIKYMHIGGDEVWSLKDCVSCKSASKVYLKHMLPVIENALSRQVTPIIWDDMMRTWNVEDLKIIGSRRVQPMVWAYPSQLSHVFPEGMWQRYGQSFKSIWFASAFKGADTPSTNYVPIVDRIDNHKSWLKIYAELQLQDRHIKVNGIALTGWSRFDHFASMCELLPAGLPSLALCLAVLKEGTFSNKTLWRVSEELGFKTPVLLNRHDIPGNASKRDEGNFLGHSIYGVVMELRRAYNTLDSVEKRIPAWFNQRHLASLKISNYQLSVCFQRIEKATKRLTNLLRFTKKKLMVVYNDETANEWIWDKIKNKLARVQEMKKDLMKFQNAKMKTE